MPKAYLDWGNWNAICDVCGFRFKASELKQDWKGLRVCQQDYELRHPQDFIRVRGDNPAVPWTRPEGEDIFVAPACYLWDQSCYTGLAVTGCAQVGWQKFTSVELYNLKFPPLPA